MHKVFLTKYCSNNIKILTQFLRGWDRLVSLIHHLIKGPAVQIGSDLHPVPLLLLIRVPLLGSDHEIAHSGSLLLMLQWSLDDSCL